MPLPDPGDVVRDGDHLTIAVFHPALQKQKARVLTDGEQEAFLRPSLLHNSERPNESDQRRDLIPDRLHRRRLHVAGQSRRGLQRLHVGGVVRMHSPLPQQPTQQPVRLGVRGAGLHAPAFYRHADMGGCALGANESPPSRREITFRYWMRRIITPLNLNQNTIWPSRWHLRAK